MNKLQLASQLNKALKFFATTLDDEKALEVSEVFDMWESGTDYKADDIIRYGVNGVGDSQLYRVLQAHTSQDDWKPDETPSLYKAMGIAPSGYPEWSQPVGAADAYNKLDIVSYEGTLYISDIDANVWSPTTYGWSVYEEE